MRRKVAAHACDQDYSGFPCLEKNTSFWVRRRPLHGCLQNLNCHYTCKRNRESCRTLSGQPGPLFAVFLGFRQLPHDTGFPGIVVHLRFGCYNAHADNRTAWKPCSRDLRERDLCASHDRQQPHHSRQAFPLCDADLQLGVIAKILTSGELARLYLRTLE